MTLTIAAIDPYFMPRDDAEEARTDQCLHGGVRVSAGEVVLIDTGSDDLTLSAAGLYLLRSLEADHVPGDKAGTVTDLNPMFPCCGFTVYRGESRAEISGCPNGEDLQVIATGASVSLTAGTRTVTVTRDDWHTAVLAFVRSVEEFYRSQPLRAPYDVGDPGESGWPQFWEEWREIVAGIAPETESAGD